jgi:hypothetical protein
MIWNVYWFKIWIWLKKLIEDKYSDINENWGKSSYVNFKKNLWWIYNDISEENELETLNYLI